MASAHKRLIVQDHIDVDLILTALQIPHIATAFRDLQADACRILEKLTHNTTPTALDVIEAGFFRDRNDFIVGRWVMPDDAFIPCDEAPLNSPEGAYADAILQQVSDIHDLLSTT